MHSQFHRDALASLPSPDELRRALSRRVREADVLRRLLRVSEFAVTELRDPDSRATRREGASHAERLP